jgi:hypothetical protein
VTWQKAVVDDSLDESICFYRVTLFVRCFSFEWRSYIQNVPGRYRGSTLTTIHLAFLLQIMITRPRNMISAEEVYEGEGIGVLPIHVQ